MLHWLCDLVPSADSRLPLSTRSVFTDIMPPILAYYATATLAVLPGTFFIRLACLPLTLWFAFRAVTRVDIALTWNDPGFKCLDFGFGLNMVIISMRAIEWTIHQKPLRRMHRRPTSSPESHMDASSFEEVVDEGLPSLPGALLNACDLTSDFRGINWSWSQRFSIPKETRPTTSTSVFIAHTIISAVVHFIIFDASVHVVRSFSPSTFGCPDGGSILDVSLPPFARYARSSVITVLSGIMFYAVIQWIYDVNTVNVILLFRQSPSQWPPLFDAPWRATSVSDFWGKRWHQLFKSSFVQIGVKPLPVFMGKASILGAFFVSAILHDWGMWAMGRGSYFGRVGGFFGMMGIGCILEDVFHRISGTKVQSWWGWLWTMAWIVGWGNWLVDTWARTGLLGSTIMPDVTEKVLLAIVTFKT